MRSRCSRWDVPAGRHAASKQQNVKALFGYLDDINESNNSGFGNTENTGSSRQQENDDGPDLSTPIVSQNPDPIVSQTPDPIVSQNPDPIVSQNPDPIVSQNPDRAISIVSELKANAALFAAFAFGSLNLPNTLTVSESKVTSVTTSLSISRPLPDSDLIRTFVVLDICTLCLMISCVAASQLLIYRLTDGSYEDVDENYYGDAYNSQRNNPDGSVGSRRRKNSRESALGRLVTTYRNEFTVARLTFDLGLVTLLSAVAVRSLAIFDEDIVVPIAIVIGITAVFLAVAYFTTYIEVFRTAENLTDGPFFSLPFFNNDSEDIDENDPDGKNQVVSWVVLPFTLVSVGLGLYFSLTSGLDFSDPNLSRLGPYDVTSGASKLKVVTEKIDSENREAKKQRNKLIISKKARAKAASEKAEAEAAKKKAVEEEAKQKAEEEANKKAEEEAKKQAEEEAKKKAEEENLRKLEKQARMKAEEEAAAATAAAKAKVEAALEAAKKKSQEEATATTS